MGMGGWGWDGDGDEDGDGGWVWLVGWICWLVLCELLGNFSTLVDLYPCYVRDFFFCHRQFLLLSGL